MDAKTYAEVVRRLNDVARQHSKECQSVTKHIHGEGWLCNKCDADFDTYPHEENAVVEYFEEERN